MCCMTSPPNNIIDAPSKYTVIVLRKWGRNNISSTSNFKLLWTSQMYNSSALLEASSWLNISDYQIGSMVFLFTVFFMDRNAVHYWRWTVDRSFWPQAVSSCVLYKVFWTTLKKILHTSWTPDEDFGILFQALQQLDEQYLLLLCVIIPGSTSPLARSLDHILPFFVLSQALVLCVITIKHYSNSLISISFTSILRISISCRCSQNT